MDDLIKELLSLDRRTDEGVHAVCGRCGRKTWADDQFGEVDQLTQPDGLPCGGRFGDPRG